MSEKQQCKSKAFGCYLLSYIILAGLLSSFLYNFSGRYQVGNQPHTASIPIIFINGTDPAHDWNDCPWVNGSGTYGDPYVIRDVIVDGSSGDAITIINIGSSVFFNITNCSMVNHQNGIRLDNVTNGIVNDNNCSSSSSHGIYATSARNCTFIDNTCSDNAGNGMRFFMLEDVFIINNTCTNCYTCIYAEFGQRVVIENNTCRSVDYEDGIVVWEVDYLNITNNDCDYVYNMAINLHDSVYVRVINNTAAYTTAGAGIWMQNCLYCTVDGNKVMGDGSGFGQQYGIYLGIGSIHSNITNNDCRGNAKYGIYLHIGVSISYLNVIGNNCSGCDNPYLPAGGNGIYIGAVHNSTISYNDVSDCKYSVRFGAGNAANNTLSHNKGLVRSNTTQIYKTQNIKYDYSIVNNTAMTFQWNFTDGTANSTASKPVHQYNVSGNLTTYVTINTTYQSYFFNNLSVEILPEPTAPSNLVATRGDQHIILNWTAPDPAQNILGYNIYRSYVTGEEVFFATIGNVTGYNNTGLTNGQIYFYLVQAFNPAGNGTNSTEVNATPGTIPSVPLNLVAIPGINNITLYWDVPSDNGGYAITNYGVYRGNVSGSETFLVLLGNVTIYVDAPLNNGETWFYLVCAINDIGNSTNSSEASGTVFDLPSAPLNLRAIFSNTITLYWDAPASDGGTAIIGYRIFRENWYNNETIIYDVGLVLTFADVTGLILGQLYFYRISAHNIVGYGQNSTETYGYIYPTCPDCPPCKLTGEEEPISNEGLFWIMVLLITLGGTSITFTILYFRSDTRTLSGSGKRNRRLNHLKKKSLETKAKIAKTIEKLNKGT